jgi:hypothetical protein
MFFAAAGGETAIDIAINEIKVGTMKLPYIEVKR